MGTDGLDLRRGEEVPLEPFPSHAAGLALANGGGRVRGNRSILHGEIKHSAERLVCAFDGAAGTNGRAGVAVQPLPEVAAISRLYLADRLAGKELASVLQRIGVALDCAPSPLLVRSQPEEVIRIAVKCALARGVIGVWIKLTAGCSGILVPRECLLLGAVLPSVFARKRT